MGSCARKSSQCRRADRHPEYPMRQIRRYTETREPPWLAKRLRHLQPREHLAAGGIESGERNALWKLKTSRLCTTKQAQRFEAHVGGQTAFLTYRRFPDRFVLVHTEVPPALEDQGIAGKLVAAALDFARAAHLRVVPLCPYVSDFISKHPEYQDLLSEQDRAQILEHMRKVRPRSARKRSA